MIYLYNFLLRLLLPVLFIRLLFKQRKSKKYQKYSQKGRWKERLAFIPNYKFESNPIWIHTVSVGEFIAVLPLISLLLENHPDIPIVITTTTLTGSDQVLTKLGDKVSHVYIPWDLPSNMARFYRKLKPRIALIMETEIWPNLIFEANKKQIPVLLINARMSEKSANSYRYISKLIRLMLQKFTHICVQNKNDMQRFVTLGADENRLTITGNIKFDLNINNELLTLAKKIKQYLLWQNRTIVLASSTHQGEDELIIDLFNKLRQKDPQLKLIIVPRHPERFEKVELLARKNNNYQIVKRSDITSKQQSNVDILIGDSLGEMILYYGMASIVIMGGTFIPHGGHNVLEPAVLEKPIFCGPSMYNFATINSLFLSSNASIQVKDIDELKVVLEKYLENPESLKNLGLKAKELMDKNTGSKEKIYDIIKDYRLLN